MGQIDVTPPSSATVEESLVVRIYALKRRHSKPNNLFFYLGFIGGLITLTFGHQFFWLFACMMLVVMAQHSSAERRSREQLDLLEEVVRTLEKQRAALASSPEN